MTTIKEIRDRLVESIAVCEEFIGSEAIGLLDREYIRGQKAAFEVVLKFIGNDQ